MLQVLSGSRIFARTMPGMRESERVLSVFRRCAFFTCQGDDAFVVAMSATGCVRACECMCRQRCLNRLAGEVFTWMSQKDATQVFVSVRKVFW